MSEQLIVNNLNNITNDVDNSTNDIDNSTKDFVFQAFEVPYVFPGHPLYPEELKIKDVTPITAFHGSPERIQDADGVIHVRKWRPFRHNKEDMIQIKNETDTTICIVCTQDLVSVLDNGGAGLNAGAAGVDFKFDIAKSLVGVKEIKSVLKLGPNESQKIMATSKFTTVSVLSLDSAISSKSMRYKKMVLDLTEAVPSNDKDPGRAPGTTDIYTMTTEHAELYKKLIRDLTETVPTSDKVLETAQCRMLMVAYDDDLLARRKAYDLWDRTKTIKKSDDAVTAQFSTNIIERLETILRNATGPVSIVFYNTMKGDYYHHMAEYLTDHDKRKKTMYQDWALGTFMTAKESATSSGMSVNDPIYLELHISLAKLYYLMRLYGSARLANISAFNASCKCKDRLDEEDRKLSAAIHERMRNLMNRWTDDANMGYT
ncbi:hypothetical protein BGZ96_010368 [Linnemannia gamsii]|uniref:14-3-3 domain-containing protein n=1 Tax=Linnemannia gamsii TaxID=64522 RepID=A0ABQ7JW95_9FUNG|nr:hypothetical protein BGZ96_010368 [Linnemannia gamsii]